MSESYTSLEARVRKLEILYSSLVQDVKYGSNRNAILVGVFTIVLLYYIHISFSWPCHMPS
jgi:hypothetical protein